MYYTYILHCADGTLYTGVTNNLDRRLAQHNKGEGLGAKYTRARTPVEIVYSASFANRSLAQKEESRIKSLTKPQKEKLVKDGFPKDFTIENKIWIWPGESANWYFIYIDIPLAQQIREKTKGQRGFGSVRVRAILGKTTWESSMFWSARDNCYIFPIKKDVRKKEGVGDGDEVRVRFELV